MATKKKLLQAAAGQAGGGAGLDVEDVFSTYLYEGTGSTQTITNGIDLDGEGGLVWLKSRASSYYHWLFDTERGAGASLKTNDTDAENPTLPNSLSSFNSDGFSVVSLNGINNSGEDIVSWTFRKAPKFFDVVTYTGDGSADRQISHNLGTTVGAMIIKQTSASGENWVVYHRSNGATGALYLNDTRDVLTADSFFNDTEPTNTNFTISNTFGVNRVGYTYVAYLFAHNDGDGEFGPDGDLDIIKCGSFTPPSSGEQEVSIGFEPQFIITFDTGGGDNWRVYDTMRGWDVTNRQLLNPNQSAAESSLSNTGGYEIKPTATGFIHEGHTASSPHIYIAIRRGPMAVPTDATDVFAIDAVNSSEPYFTSGFPIDMAFYKSTSGSSGYVSSRLTGLTEGELDTTAAFGSATAVGYDKMTGFVDAAGNPGANYYAWMWKRAPGYFDVVAYVGNRTGGASQTISHNLTVTPEMIWVKNRTEAQPWQVYTAATGNTKAMYLDTTNGATTDNSWGNTSPTETNFTVGDDSGTNNTGNNHIAYLFASLPGISKVGSYTGNGGTQNIDCGFSSGARFVLIKRSSNAQDWYIFDSTRGIVAGNDPYLKLNTTDAEATAADEIDPLSSGFTIHQTGSAGINFSGHTYIFYAIA